MGGEWMRKKIPHFFHLFEYHQAVDKYHHRPVMCIILKTQLGDILLAIIRLVARGIIEGSKRPFFSHTVPGAIGL